MSQNNSTIHTVIVKLALILTLISLPQLASASIFDIFVGKVKGVFEKESVYEEETPSSATMFALTANSVAKSPTSSVQTGVADSLSVTTGSLRYSSEDISFPESDEISVYEVKDGDTVETVAKLFNVSRNTIIWANDLKSTKLTPGKTLVILPVTGIKHKAKSGDTVESIAKKYKADTGDIALFNGVLPEAVFAGGEEILVPDGEITVAKAPAAKVVPKASAVSMFRPVNGVRTQGIHGHNGVDIAAPIGRSVYSALSGTVITAKASGYNGGYGNLVIIKHANGVSTVYAHLNDVYVYNGQKVDRGEQIGTVGNTGRSTGPHLHFEVRGARNPF